MHRNSQFCFLFLCIAMLSSCSIIDRSTTMSVYLTPAFEQYKIRRVVLLPLQYQGKMETKITSKLGGALQSAQKFEVITITPQQLQKVYPYPQRWDQLIPAAMLVSLSRKFQAQGIIRGRITQYQTMPMALGIKVDLISTSDGHILWSADGTFQDENLYNKKYISPQRSMEVISPEYFTEKACWKLANTLQSITGEQELRQITPQEPQTLLPRFMR